MAQAHSLCLVRQGALSSSQAVQALKITLQDLGIDPGVLENPLVEKVRPRFQGLLGLIAAWIRSTNKRRKHCSAMSFKSSPRRLDRVADGRTLRSGMEAFQCFPAGV